MNEQMTRDIRRFSYLDEYIPVHGNYREKHDEEVHQVDRRGSQHIRHQRQPRVEPKKQEQAGQAQHAPSDDQRLLLPTTHSDRLQLLADLDCLRKKKNPSGWEIPQGSPHVTRVQLNKYRRP